MESQESNHFFTDNGISDIERGVELYQAMGVSHEDLIFGKDQTKFREISEFVGQFGDSLPLIRSAMSKKPMDVSPVDHIFGFVLLQKKRMSMREALKQVEAEISLYE